MKLKTCILMNDLQRATPLVVSIEVCEKMTLLLTWFITYVNGVHGSIKSLKSSSIHDVHLYSMVYLVSNKLLIHLERLIANNATTSGSKKTRWRWSEC